MVSFRFKLHIHVSDVLAWSLLLSQDHFLLCADGSRTPSCSPAPLITRQGTIYSGSSIVIILSTLQLQLRSDRVEAASSDAAVIFDDFSSAWILASDVLPSLRVHWTCCAVTCCFPPRPVPAQ